MYCTRPVSAIFSAWIDTWVREPWMLSDEEQAGQIVSVETFRQNVSGLANIVTLQGYSPQDFVGWQRTIDLLFDDCVHTNPTLHKNLTFWTPFVRTGGWLSGHDYSNDFPDVKAEVNELATHWKTPVDFTVTLWSMQLPGSLGKE